MQYFVIFAIIAAVIVNLVKSSIKHGWIFIILGFIGASIFGMLAEFGSTGEFFATIFSISSIAAGIYGMTWKLKQNKQKETVISDIPDELRSKTKHGFFFGVKDENYIIKSENKDGHILVVGGVGSGKSSCIAIPTLQMWRSRVLAIDIKGELYETTKNFRPNIKLFNPQDKNSYGYDPYVFIRQSKNPAQEARAIAETIIPLPHDVDNPFWIKSARNVFTGAILHYYMDLSFIDTLRQINDLEDRELIKIISKSNNESARRHISGVRGLDDKTLAGVFSEFRNEILTLTEDTEVASALSRAKTINPEDLENNRDIYIKIPEDNISKWGNLLTIIVSQFIRFFERRNEDNNTPILFMIDEFARLGKFSDIANGLATLRSKKITFCIIIQSLPQLDDIYGSNVSKVISDTCSYKAVLSVSEADSQETFSRLFGTDDKPQVSKGETFIPGLDFFAFGKSKNTSTQEKRKIKPEDFATLVRDKKLVLITPYGNFIIDKRPYYM